MSKEYRAIIPLDNQKADNAALAESGAFRVPPKSLFHYTSREVFWKIVEDETFLARHILFSNDYEEYELGKQKIDKPLKEIGFDKDVEELERNERYMICFCEENDLLSQWRGYAQNGIAMEFDFSLGRYGINDAEGTRFSAYHCFTLVNNDVIKMENEDLANSYDKRYISDGDDERLIALYITAPYKVFYVDKEYQKDREFESITENIKKMDVAVPRLIKLIPYIKNQKFDEEREYRLLFDLGDLLSAKKEWIRGEKNIYLDVAGIKKPNIRVEFGNALERLQESVKIYYRNDLYKEELEEFLAGEKNLLLELEKVHESALKENEILLGNGKKQDKVMRALSAFIQTKEKIFKNTKVWCDGHLPIRRIIVGPSKDAELMRKSIVQYKHNKYWMKYIDVIISDIPFRD